MTTKQTSSADPVTSLRLPDKLRKRIHRASRKLDMTQSDAMRTAMEIGLDAIEGKV